MDKLKGGLADNKKAEDFDPVQLRAGTEVEMEHTNNRETAEEIAKDHLTEDPNYYKKLKKMEANESKKISKAKLIKEATTEVKTTPPEELSARYERSLERARLANKGSVPGTVRDIQLERVSRAHPEIDISLPKTTTTKAGAEDEKKNIETVIAARTGDKAGKVSGEEQVRLNTLDTVITQLASQESQASASPDKVHVGGGLASRWSGPPVKGPSEPERKNSLKADATKEAKGLALHPKLDKTDKRLPASSQAKEAAVDPLGELSPEVRRLVGLNDKLIKRARLRSRERLSGESDESFRNRIGNHAARLDKVAGQLRDEVTGDMLRGRNAHIEFSKSVESQRPDKSQLDLAIEGGLSSQVKHYLAGQLASQAELLGKKASAFKFSKKTKR